MKNKSSSGPGLIVALGSPEQSPDREGERPLADTRGPVDAESEAINLDTVPLDALSMPDDQEQMQPPEVGDVVNYQVTGKVVAIEGNMARIERQSINGQDVSNEPDPSSQDSGAASDDGDQSGSLRDQAAGIGMLS